MVGLSESDMEQIQRFAETPRYERSPEQLVDEDGPEPEATRPERVDS